MKVLLVAAKICLLFTILAQPILVKTQSPHKVSLPSVRAALDARAPALLAKYRVASISVALVENGRVVLERAYGEQSFGVPATPATLFNLASLTKPVTAEVLLRLTAAGRLSAGRADSEVLGRPGRRC